MRRLYKTGIGLTTGFIGSDTITHSYSVYTSLSTVAAATLSEDCCSARILTRNSLSKLTAMLHGPRYIAWDPTP
jgi:hypothetical protein